MLTRNAVQRKENRSDPLPVETEVPGTQDRSIEAPQPSCSGATQDSSRWSVCASGRITLTKELDRVAPYLDPARPVSRDIPQFPYLNRSTYPNDPVGPRRMTATVAIRVCVAAPSRQCCSISWGAGGPRPFPRSVKACPTRIINVSLDRDGHSRFVIPGTQCAAGHCHRAPTSPLTSAKMISTTGSSAFYGRHGGRPLLLQQVVRAAGAGRCPRRRP